MKFSADMDDFATVSCFSEADQEIMKEMLPEMLGGQVWKRFVYKRAFIWTSFHRL